MQFSIKEWRRYYDFTHSLGKLLKDSRPGPDDSPPKNNLDDASKACIEAEIEKSIKDVRKYLNSCGMVLPEPLWEYNSDEPKTWPSHESFAYGFINNCNKMNKMLSTITGNH